MPAKLTSAIRQEMKEHPWAGRAVAARIARDHARRNPAGTVSAATVDHPISMEPGWPVWTGTRPNRGKRKKKKLPRDIHYWERMQTYSPGSRFRFHMSNGNAKIGKLFNASLTPVVSCNHDAPCRKWGQCYALNAVKNYVECRVAWADNWHFWQWFPDIYFDLVYHYTRRRMRLDIKREKDTYFRWHVGGDIPDQRYLEGMKALARKLPAVHFLCFTKMQSLDYSSTPANLQIIFSMWPGWGWHMHSGRSAWLWDEEHDGRIPANHFLCPGECPSCGRCWMLDKLGHDVVFVKHPVSDEVHAELVSAYEGRYQRKLNPSTARVIERSKGVYALTDLGEARPFVPSHWR
jgi:hypothetical protein